MEVYEEVCREEGKEGRWEECKAGMVQKIMKKKRKVNREQK